MLLTIQNQFSWTGKNDVTDEAGNVLYETEGLVQLFQPRRWHLRDAQDVVAAFERRFAWFKVIWGVALPCGNSPFRKLGFSSKNSKSWAGRSMAPFFAEQSCLRISSLNTAGEFWPPPLDGCSRSETATRSRCDPPIRRSSCSWSR